jgi:hypothetical protein
MPYICTVNASAATEALKEGVGDHVTISYYSVASDKFPVPLCVFDVQAVACIEGREQAFTAKYVRESLLIAFRRFSGDTKINLADRSQDLLLVNDGLSINVPQKGILPDHRGRVAAIFRASATRYGKPQYLFHNDTLIVAVDPPSKVYTLPHNLLSAREWFELLSGKWKS